MTIRRFTRPYPQNSEAYYHMGRAPKNPDGTSSDKPPRDSKSWKEPFLAALRNSGNVRASCNAAKVSRIMVYKERDQSKEFADQWDEAKEEAIELLEGICRQRAMNNSDVLMMFLLKAHRPDVYRERTDVNLKGRLDQEIVVDLVNTNGDKDE